MSVFNSPLEWANEMNRQQRVNIRKFRSLLNSEDVGDSKHRHLCYRQRTRMYGDYLYFQDREKFLVDMDLWLKSKEGTK